MSNLRKIELDESVVISGDKNLVTHDSETHDLLRGILLQMRMMNMHLEIINDEVLTETDIEAL